MQKCCLPLGQWRGCLNARGFKQLEGQHCFADTITSPVTNPNTIQILLTLMCMHPKWIAEILYVEFAFLQGEFKDGEVMYIDVSDGMEQYYGSQKDVVLLLKILIYGTKQAALCFYKTLVKRMKNQGYERLKVDPCLYFVWNKNRLAVMVSWVDNLLVMGEFNDVEQIKLDMKETFGFKFKGALKEYVGNKIDCSQNNDRLGTVKSTQPVLIQKLEDEFKLPDGKSPRMPAIAGQVLVHRGNDVKPLNQKETIKYQSGTVLCMYKMQ